ncbi:hypothetical protein LCGC14_2080070 [marine sediment metagenome]|uniref:Uncharacterized protein n=1 Tax=marine sediment metagenome TaxID=412755 RepID=A0A0F9EFR1_9ZZZZ
MSEDRLDWPTITIDRDAKTGEHLYILKPDEYDRFKAEVKRLRNELTTSHRFLNDIGPPPDLPLPDRLRHWQNYCRVMRDDMREKDTTIATLREALEPFVRDYPTEVREKGPLPPGYTSDEFDAHCVFCDQGDRRTFTVRPHSKDCPIYGAKKALDHTEEEDGPLFEGKWTGSMGPTEGDK